MSWQYLLVDVTQDQSLVACVNHLLEKEGRLDGSTGQQVRALGREFTAYQADFSQRPQVDAFLTQVQADFPRLDILVNNAGTIRRAPAAEHTAELWDAVLRVNLDAPFRVVRAIGGQMLRQGAGKIIFTASLLYFSGWYPRAGLRGQQGAIGSPLAH